MNIITLVSISLGFSFFNTFIIHIIKTKFPKSYFSLGQLVVTDQDDISISGLLTKFVPPILISIIIGLLFNQNGLEITILFGFFSSFLVIWPVILSGDELLSWEAKRKIKVLYLIYFFYILSYISFSLLGFLVGKTIKGVQFGVFFSKIVQAYSNWTPFVQGIVSNTISGLIVAIIAWFFATVFRALMKKFQNILIEEKNKIILENEDK